MTQLGQLPGQKLRFVLSAGRTGTVFLTHALADHFTNYRVLHEPSPGRVELVLANFRNRTGLGSGPLRELFTRSRQRRLDDLGDAEASIEVNPFLCPFTDIVGEMVDPLFVVHLVRHPLSWAQSITQFRASGWRKHVVDYIPYAKPYPPRRPSKWRSKRPFEKSLWRWRFCNEQILTLKDRAESFVTVRYEDLFSSDPADREHAISLLLKGLQLDCRGSYDWFDTKIRVNRSADTRTPPASIDPQKLEAICGALMQRFGYVADTNSV